MSNVTTINAPGAPAQAASYSHAAKVGNMIYLSGQIPLTPDGKPVEGSIADKTTQVLENIKTVLKASNSSLENIVKVNIFLADIKYFSELNVVYAKYFKAHKPARSCVAVAALPLNADLEIEVVAVENN
ncbi:hypothetical protein KAFR_0L00860 [Kazachstania africana CBS 2517]|uniref:Uncharacterized protein n=1 Tax=Kazachstania africana (strain ATCC 22294 / BCRC 22015 / CBS 2517 / CECT 1963 / NBRC 1671 / NRRL Y-8276) TaxID=1071382 RepID=H2B244_KAZAF|nr:hypothetical protein KAFR_0L00860 [Kazachstania africana CBS 2517]CCF60694.1 hypothetical protein KAFR_0L00860 [Kazachstania africana CBS 2517]